VNLERDTRRISPSDPGASWKDLLQEIHGLQPEDRFNVELTTNPNGELETERVGALVSEGYSFESDSNESLVLVPRPCGVLYVFSPFGKNNSPPVWIARVPGSSFRQYLLGLNASEETFALFAPECVEESWHLDAFVRPSAWAQFIIEFIGSRKIDLVQVINAPIGVDLSPTLDSAYPFVRLVVDIGETGPAWPTYVSSRYGNLVDAFVTPHPEAVGALEASHISPSKIWSLEVEHWQDDEAVGAMHAQLYGQLIAALVSSPVAP
jgi:hypothetical protein